MNKYLAFKSQHLNITNTHKYAYMKSQNINSLKRLA